MKTREIPRFKPKENPLDLTEFTGTETYYKQSFMFGMVYTDGVKYLMETRSCYWLLQTIYAVKNTSTILKGEPFLTCELSVDGDHAVLVFTDGNNNILQTEDIPYTDFQGNGVCLWYVDNVVLLPSEY